jgi:hypothetical protein
MNFASNSLPCFGSGRIWRFATTRLLGIFGLAPTLCHGK